MKSLIGRLFGWPSAQERPVQAETVWAAAPDPAPAPAPPRPPEPSYLTLLTIGLPLDREEAGSISGSDRTGTVSNVVERKVKGQ